MEVIACRGVPERVISVLSGMVESGEYRIARPMKHGKYRVLNLPSFYRAVVTGDKIYCMSHERYNNFRKNKRL